MTNHLSERRALPHARTAVYSGSPGQTTAEVLREVANDIEEEGWSVIALSLRADIDGEMVTVTYEVL